MPSDSLMFNIIMMTTVYHANGTNMYFILWQCTVPPFWAKSSLFFYVIYYFLLSFSVFVLKQCQLQHAHTFLDYADLPVMSPSKIRYRLCRRSQRVLESVKYISPSSPISTSLKNLATLPASGVSADNSLWTLPITIHLSSWVFRSTKFSVFPNIYKNLTTDI